MKRGASVFVIAAISLFAVSKAFAEDPVHFADANLKAAVEAALGVSDPTPNDMLALTYLNASNLGIADLTGLEHAVNLTGLEASNNQIDDISVLSGLTNLTALVLSHNQISDILPIASLTGLTRVCLTGNQIPDISPLSGLSSLTWIELAYNQITDITAVSGMTGLTGLYLYSNGINDVSALSGMTNLTDLDLSSNQISSISPLAGLTNLTSLELRDNQIADICALSGLTRLTILGLSSNQISDLSALSGLTNLIRLVLDENQIADISPLSGLRLLNTLALSSNQIADIGALAELSQMRELHLFDNRIGDISAISGLPGLAELGLGGNQVVDISALSDFHNLTFLNLVRNPLNANACAVHIPCIRANNPGVALYYDPCIEQRSLTVSSTSGGDVTTPGEGIYTFDHGTTVSLAATSDAHYHFVNWTGPVANSASASTTMTVTADMAIEAVFAMDRHLLTVGSDGNGLASGSGTYDWGSVVSITATPDVHYHFVHWTADASVPVANVNSSSTSVTIHGDGMVTAQFAIDQQTLTVSSGGNGSASGSGTYNWGSTVPVTATANIHYHFAGWTGTAVAAGKVADPASASTTITADADYTLQANFVIDRHILTISSTAGGSVTNPGEGTFACDHGATVPITAIAESGFHFTHWSGSAVDAGKVANPNSPHTSVTVDGDSSLIANFGSRQFTLTISCPDGGSVDVVAFSNGSDFSCSGEGSWLFDEGTEVTITAIPEPCRRFVQWSGNVSSSDSTLTVVMTGDYDLQAVFDYQQQVLTISSSNGGFIAVPAEGDIVYDCGQRGCAVAVPEAGYRFVGWSGTLRDTGGIEDPRSARIEFVINANATLHADFVPVVQTIYVDGDRPQDPSPGDSSSSEPEENGSWEHPFDRIQEGIDAAKNGEAVLVLPGRYYENIDFRGKNITVSSFDPNGLGAVSRTILDGNDLGSVVTFAQGENANSVLAGFTMMRGQAIAGGGIWCFQASPIIVNCLIVGNRADVGAGASLVQSDATFVNCTVADNFSRVTGGGLFCSGRVLLTDSIVWRNLPQNLDGDPNESVRIMYSDIGTGGTTIPIARMGVVSIDPLFARIGYWAHPESKDVVADPNSPQVIWVCGDYHLMSRQGRWEPMTMTWVLDALSSPCIDRGAPAVNHRAEPAPNGNRINLGAFAGTAEASKSP